MTAAALPANFASSTIQKTTDSVSAALGIRGLAVMLIVVTHYVPTQYFSFNIARPLTSFMFVATGFFWASLLSREPLLRSPDMASRANVIMRLLLSRHIRIWPVMAVIILGYVALGLIDGGPLTTQILETWPLYLSYLGNVPKYMFEGQAFPSHFWVISSQEQMIFAVSLFMVFFGYDRFRYVILPLLVISVASRVIGAAVFMPDHTALALDTPFAIGDSLMIGFYLHSCLKNADRTMLRRRIASALLAIIIVWSCLPNTNSSYFGLAPLFGALFGAYIIVVTTDPNRAPEVLRTIVGSSFLNFCGTISFSLFLIHPLVNTFLILAYPKITGQLMPWETLALLAPPLAFLAAAALYNAVELPLISLRRGSRLGNGSGRHATAAKPVAL